MTEQAVVMAKIYVTKIKIFKVFSAIMKLKKNFFKHLLLRDRETQSVSRGRGRKRGRHRI